MEKVMGGGGGVVITMNQADQPSNKDVDSTRLGMLLLESRPVPLFSMFFFLVICLPCVLACDYFYFHFEMHVPYAFIE